MESLFFLDELCVDRRVLVFESQNKIFVLLAKQSSLGLELFEELAKVDFCVGVGQLSFEQGAEHFSVGPRDVLLKQLVKAVVFPWVQD